MSETAYWEPHRFTVGDRVKINVSPECPIHGQYPPLPEGSTGTVAGPPPFLGEDAEILASHPIGVWFDRPFYLGNHRIRGGDFAAVELEPLDAPR